MINATYNHYPSICDLKVKYAVLLLSNRSVDHGGAWGSWSSWKYV